jgi:DNA-binding response OmpR family regulator
MRTAMVVEDDSIHRELLEVFLETMGFRPVWVADSAVDAQQVYRNAVPRPSIVLVDQQLGGTDGLRLVRDLAKLDVSVRIIFLSDDLEVERDCYRAGASGFIKKPFSLAEIGRAVNLAMRPGVVS